MATILSFVWSAVIYFFYLLQRIPGIKSRKLFLSFRGTIRELKHGRITEEDLRMGLFYFGCTREHAMNPSAHSPNELTWFFNSLEEAEPIHKTLVFALLKAEQEGRVIWRSLNEQPNFDQLNRLLRANWLVQIPGRLRFYSPSIAKEQLLKWKITLEAVY